jgi:hypothetical protein
LKKIRLNLIHSRLENYLFKEVQIIFMSKGIAINTILYLLVGILVVAVLVYLVYTYAVGPGMDIQDCRSRVQNYCTSCKIADWASGFGTITAGSDIETCIDTYFVTAGFEPEDADCSEDGDGDVGATEAFCAQFIS